METEGKCDKVKAEPKTFVEHPLTTAILGKNLPSFLDAMSEHLESLENIAVFFPNDGKYSRCIIIVFSRWWIYIVKMGTWHENLVE